ncbi:hypothetical protein F4818DRAFT_451897 [Hypoxylon cercidicola]|nr:hypothetical protein F4818DRAFT_451897 [Hypoxylon cercidicola]
MDDSFLAQLFLGLKTNEFGDARDSVVADRIARYFLPNQRLKYLGLEGAGRHGGILLFSEQDDSGRPFRKIVIKYPLSAQMDDDLRNEAKWLNVLKGAEHIGRVIPLAEAEINLTGTGKRPTVALEYIPNGTLRQFRDNFADYFEEYADEGFPMRVPSRLLWRVFLCLVRQVAAMAYPPQLEDPDAPAVRETVKPGVPPLALTQNSSHLDNFLIGDISNIADEHNPVPIIKLIDFGRGVIEDSFMEAYETNIWGAAYALVSIALPYDISRREREKDNEYYYPAEDRTFVTNCPSQFLDMNNMDWKLRTLIARCMAVELDDLPTLEEVLAECEDAVANRTIDDYGQPLTMHEKSAEKDEYIRQILRDCIFNARVKDEPPRGYDLPHPPRQLGTTLLGIRCMGKAAYQTTAGRRRRDRASVGPRTFAQRMDDMVNRAAPIPAPRQETRRQTLFERFQRRVRSIQNLRGAIRDTWSTRSSDVD